MFEAGKRIYFRDENFKSCFGTIIEKIDEDSGLVTLKVQRDYDLKEYILKKLKLDELYCSSLEKYYTVYGHY